MGSPVVLSRFSPRGMPQLTPFEYGQIKAHLHHGLTAAAIQQLVLSASGKKYAHTTISGAVQKLEADAC